MTYDEAMQSISDPAMHKLAMTDRKMVRRASWKSGRVLVIGSNDDAHWFPGVFAVDLMLYDHGYGSFTRYDATEEDRAAADWEAFLWSGYEGPTDPLNYFAD